MAGKSVRSLILLIVINLFCSYGSKIDFTATPNDIVEGVTQFFAVSCSLKDTVSNKTIQNGNDYVSTSENVVIVNSIIIRKGDGACHKDVARIVTGQVAATGADFLTGKVTGNLAHGQSDNLKYLTVTWNSPCQNLSGKYICEINAADLKGDNLKFRSNYVTTSTTATVQDLIAVVAQTRHEMNSVIQELSALVVQARQDMLAAQSRQEMLFEQAKQEITNRPQVHYEDGKISCYYSHSWEVHGGYKVKFVDVKFTKAYENVPSIIVVATGVDTQITGSSSTRYETYIDNKTKTGFRLRCQTWDDSRVHNLNVQWNSYGI